MKLLRIFAFIFAVSASFCVAYAGEQNFVLVVDFDRIQKESLVTKSLENSIEKEQKKIQTDAERIQSDFQKRADSLESQRKVLTAEVLEKKQKALESEAIATDSEFRERIKNLEERKNTALLKINDEIKAISAKIAKEKNASVVLPANFVIYYLQSSDVTDEVLKSLNSKLTSVAL